MIPWDHTVKYWQIQKLNIKGKISFLVDSHFTWQLYFYLSNVDMWNIKESLSYRKSPGQKWKFAFDSEVSLSNQMTRAKTMYFHPVSLHWCLACVTWLSALKALVMALLEKHPSIGSISLKGWAMCCKWEREKGNIAWYFLHKSSDIWFISSFFVLILFAWFIVCGFFFCFVLDFVLSFCVCVIH